MRKEMVAEQNGNMVPLNVLLQVPRVVGPELVERFNGFPPPRPQATRRRAIPKGQVTVAIEEVAREVLSADYTIGWIDSAYQEIATSGSGTTGVTLGMVTVFLILAVQ